MLPASLLACLMLCAAGADSAPALVVRAPVEAGPRLVSALTARLPTVRVVTGGQGALPEDVLVTLVPAQERWELVVERRGERALQRAMPVAAAGPDAAFFVACAAVVERWLQGIEWKGRAEAIDPDAVAVPRPPPPPPSPSSELAPPPNGPSEEIDWSLGVSVGGAAGIEQGSWRVGPALDLALRRSGLFGAFRAQVYVPEGRDIEPARPDRPEQGGHIEDLSASVAILAGPCRGESVRVCGGLQLGWRGTWVWGASADLYRWQTGHGDAYLAGLFALLAVPLPARLEVRALLTGAAFVGDDGFYVEGAAAPVMTPPRYEVGLALGLARRVP